VGLAEVIRRGFTQADIAEVAELLLAAHGGALVPVRRRVATISARFSGVHFGYDRDCRALAPYAQDDVLV
jgi:hypothetical protein